MTQIRRLYVYLAAFVSLDMALFGLANLVRVLLERLTGDVGEYLFITGGDLFRRQVSFFAALVVIGVPVWLAHWVAAERWTRGTGPAADEERLARTRSIYLAVVLGLATLLPAGVGAWRLIAGIAGRIFGQADPLPLAGAVGTLLVCGAFWGYHWRVWEQDAARSPEVAIRAGWHRFSVYLAAVVGLFVFAGGLAGLARLLVRLVLGDESTRVLRVADRWWAAPMAGGLASVLVGLLVWSFHWGLATRLAEQESPAGYAERRSFVRWLTLFGVLFATIVITLTQLTVPMRGLLLLALGESRAELDQQAGPGGFWAAFVSAFLTAGIYAMIWLYHARRVRREELLVAAAGGEPRRVAELRRLHNYLVALAGLGAFVGGSIGLVTTLGNLATESAVLYRPAGWWRDPTATATAFLVVGLIVWAWQWAPIQRRTAEIGAAERRSVVRRGYLALAAGGGLLILLGSVATALYILFSAFLGAGEATAERLADVIGWVVGGHFLVVYHGLIIRRDALAARAEGAAGAPDGAGVTSRVPLVLAVPAGVDVEGVVTDLRRMLPAGTTLEIANPSAGDSLDTPNATTRPTGEQVVMADQPASAG